MRSMMHALFASFAITALGVLVQESAVASETPNPESNLPHSSEPSQRDPAPATSEDSIEIIGTVVRKDIEGGFFAIDADDGSKYDPTNLPESFKKDGMRVKVSARLEKDLMSFHMYGVLIEVLKIEAL